MILKCRNYSLLFLLSAVWSLLLFHYWSYDYGLYYNQAVNISEKYKLYSNIFETKGPAYYFFIHLLYSLVYLLEDVMMVLYQNHFLSLHLDV